MMTRDFFPVTLIEMGVGPILAFLFSPPFSPILKRVGSLPD